MNIIIPNNNIPERKYIINLLMSYITENEILIETGAETLEHTIISIGRKKVYIEDHFFNKYKKPLDYLDIENIPIEFMHLHNRFSNENIPIIFGKNNLTIQENNIIIHHDIFADCYLYVTKWDEIISEETSDIHLRNSAAESILARISFLDRPIVNYFIEYLLNIFEYYKFNFSRPTLEYEVYITHDVDKINYYSDNKTTLKNILRPLKNMKLAQFYYEIHLYIKYKLNIIKDPFNTFEFLMSKSEKYNNISRFYLLVDGETKYDFKEDRSVLEDIVSLIKRRNHYIGIHPSYDSSYKVEQWENEINVLKSYININEGRQHYLRYSKDAYKLWEKYDMRDLGAGYFDNPGFKHGICYIFQPFDILTRKVLDVEIVPLTLMEGTLFSYQNIYTEEDILEIVSSLSNEVKKFRGKFNLLWHNSSFNTYQFRNMSEIYEKVLKELHE